MYGTGYDHLHQESKSTDINQKSKHEINKLFKLKLKPKRILEILEEKCLPIPNKNQLNNHLALLKQKFYGSSSINQGELESYCQKNSILPDDIDKPLVLKYQIEYVNEINEDHYCDDVEIKFRFFVKTKRLLFNGTIVFQL